MLDFIALAQECAPQVAHQTLAAIVKTESAFRPLAIGVNGGARLERQPANKDEAVVTAKWLIANGYSIDMGLGQVNSANLSRTGLTVEDAFDPCKNLAASASILHDNYQAASRKVEGEQAAVRAALSAYNTGSFTRGFANGYVQKVVSNATANPAKPAVPALVPIPLVRGAQAPKPAAAPARTPALQPPAKAADEPVRLQAEGQDAGKASPASVYGGRASTSMVY